MTGEKAGQIVWHDLFTSNRKRSMAFFQRVAGWTYQTERATDFAWGGGEKDFVLALSEDEAGAGFAETPPGMSDGWIAYVEVPDVDAAAARAEELGGVIVRHPFEVPGVGRNALLRDPLGALIGLSLSRHDFPVPRSQFGAEIYLSDAVPFPEEFYSQLFNWKMAAPRSAGRSDNAIIGCSGKGVARHQSGSPPNDAQSIWVPSIKVANTDDAWRASEAMNASRLADPAIESARDSCVFIRDSCGAYSCLSKAGVGIP